MLQSIFINLGSQPIVNVNILVTLFIELVLILRARVKFVCHSRKGKYSLSMENNALSLRSQTKRKLLRINKVSFFDGGESRV